MDILRIAIVALKLVTSQQIGLPTIGLARTY